MHTEEVRKMEEIVQVIKAIITFKKHPSHIVTYCKLFFYKKGLAKKDLEGSFTQDIRYRRPIKLYTNSNSSRNYTH